MVRVNCQNGDGGGSWVGEFSLFDTEYDREKVPLHNGNDPRPPLVV